MLDRAERWGPRLKTGSAASVVNLLRSELPDHRRAFAWFADAGATAEAARLVVSLFEFGLFNLHAEVHEWANWVAERIEDDDPLASEIVGAAALGAWFTGDTEHAVALGQRALRAAEHSGSATCWARTALVNAYGYSGQPEGLVVNFQAMVNEQARSPDPFWQLNALVFETISLSMFGRHDQADARAERALAISRRLDNPYCTYYALYALGRARTHRDPSAAIEAFDGALRAAREVDSRWNIGLALVEWLALSRRSADISDCISAAIDLLDMLTVSGNRSQMSETLREVSHLLARIDDHETAALALLGRQGLPQMPGGSADPHEDELLQAALEARLGGQWSRLRTIALATPEQQLVATCRQALLR
jgi:tetratricopeptide (TPR) repeat protein